MSLVGLLREGAGAGLHTGVGRLLLVLEGLRLGSPAIDGVVVGFVVAAERVTGGWEQD